MFDFDAPFTVTAGTVERARGEYAPELYLEDAADSTLTYDLLVQGWETVSDGYTGQYGYSGPVMHDSEQFSHGLKDFVLENDGLYALLPVVYMPEEGDVFGEPVYEGWVVVRKLSK